MVVIDTNGNLAASAATEADILQALINSGTYTAKNAVGLDINYASRTVTRTQEAEGKTMGSSFDIYPMYGGRTRCNVSDNGTITAFYGDTNSGSIIRHEGLMISATQQAGFKLAPIFNGDLEYVLFPAYDASIIDNKLASIAGQEPATNITISEAESYAAARGTGWHIMNMAAESANQMLEMVELGTMNGQAALEQGITYIPNGASGNCLFVTGSTASLGNGTGHATSTVLHAGGNVLNPNTDGSRAICYRGMENPWGNLWSMIGGIKVEGNAIQGGGTPFICTDFNYASGTYESIGFNLPSVYGWINAMGYGKEEYDWIYLPIECSSSASSLAPVGDSLWTIANLNGSVVIATGGSFGHKEACGPFYYAADRTVQETARNNYGAKLLFIPTKNEIYTANISKWNTYMGGD